MSSDGTDSPLPGDVSESACPLCGGALIPIVYGYPGPGLMDEAEAGRVRLGGCVVMGNDPAWECTVCEHWFNADLTESPPEQQPFHGAPTVATAAPVDGQWHLPVGGDTDVWRRRGRGAKGHDEQR